jgi:deoxyadenosine/deoxycytidine kinase
LLCLPCLPQELDSATTSYPVRLMERSIFSDRLVFVRAVQDNGWMGDMEVAVYDSMFDPILSSRPSLVPDGFIYLRCSPEVCMERWVIVGGWG